MVKESSIMPVVTLYLDRLKSLIKDKVSTDTIIGKIPYLGMDLEEVSEDHLRVEYNPNRPDFSTDYGIARALNGLLGFESGCPEYRLTDSGIRVSVDRTVREVRPYIVSLIVTGCNLDDESIRQIITMQEDIHNGMGRNRRKVSIGIHNLDVVKPPIKYTTATREFRFIPLGANKPMSIQEVLDKTDMGREYGQIVSGFNRYPILNDSTGEVLSFPPIINGELTRVSSQTKNLFIDITATDFKTSEDALAILSATLQDAGGILKSVKVEYPDRVLITPDLEPF
jgi:phenylalanyl-tRNA synthetase beta chain